MLLAAISGLAWWYAARKEDEIDLRTESNLLALRPPRSQLVTVKYSWVVAAFILVQILLGAAHPPTPIEVSG